MFSNEDKIDLIHKELKSANRRTVVVNLVEVDDVGSAVATSDKGAKFLVQFYRPHNEAIALRALHRVKNKALPYTYLFNGQGGKNLETLIFNGEQGELTWASREQVRGYWRHVAPDLGEEEFESFLFKMTGRHGTSRSHYA